MHSSASMKSCSAGKRTPRAAAGTARSSSRETGPMMQSHGHTSTQAVSRQPMHLVEIT